ncbi:MAG: hypothetical protein IKT08_01075 [Bacteroidales bacterium]|nr:hypothetical protein [Bacteroidales bacterium]
MIPFSLGPARRLKAARRTLASYAGIKLSKNSASGTTPSSLSSFSRPKTGAKVQLFPICATLLGSFFKKFFYYLKTSVLYTKKKAD